MCQLCQNSFAPIHFIQIVEEYEILRFLFVSKEVTILCCQSLKIIIIILYEKYDSWSRNELHLKDIMKYDIFTISELTASSNAG